MTKGFRKVEDCVDQMKGIGFGNDTNKYRKLMVRKMLRYLRLSINVSTVSLERETLLV